MIDWENIVKEQINVTGLVCLNCPENICLSRMKGDDKEKRIKYNEYKRNEAEVTKYYREIKKYHE